MLNISVLPQKTKSYRASHVKTNIFKERNIFSLIKQNLIKFTSTVSPCSVFSFTKQYRQRKKKIRLFSFFDEYIPNFRRFVFWLVNFSFPFNARVNNITCY